jgi:hypothetical protein
MEILLKINFTKILMNTCFFFIGLKFLSEKMDEKVFKNHQKFHIKNWYPYLKDFTFNSNTITISVEEAKAILEFSEKKTGDIPETSRKILDNLSKKIETSIRFEFSFFNSTQTNCSFRLFC